MVTKLHLGECETCLAADVCNHPCCHDWFLEIGHRLRLIDEDEGANDVGTSEETEMDHRPSPQTSQASIFSFSRAEQMEDSCDPLLYCRKSTAKPGEYTLLVIPSHSCTEVMNIAIIRCQRHHC